MAFTSWMVVSWPGSPVATVARMSGRPSPRFADRCRCAVARPGCAPHRTMVRSAWGTRPDAEIRFPVRLCRRPAGIGRSGMRRAGHLGAVRADRGAPVAAGLVDHGVGHVLCGRVRQDAPGPMPRRSGCATAACVKRWSQALALNRLRAMSAAPGRAERLLSRRGPGLPR
jgi:hypothetical protein